MIFFRLELVAFSILLLMPGWQGSSAFSSVPAEGVAKGTHTAGLTGRLDSEGVAKGTHTAGLTGRLDSALRVAGDVAAATLDVPCSVAVKGTAALVHWRSLALQLGQT